MYFQEFFPTNKQQTFPPQQKLKIYGIDKSVPMLKLASDNLTNFDFSPILGGVEALASIADSTVDLALAIDVLGYLNESELDTFYNEMRRIVRPGGSLLIMYGNELFDMFALNSGTADFFMKHFNLDVKGLLSEGESKRPQNAHRRNPLSFAAELLPYDFHEVAQSFSQWHAIPPGQGNRIGDLSQARLAMRDHEFDPNTLVPIDLWKAYFRCSIFASLSVKNS